MQTDPEALQKQRSAILHANPAVPSSSQGPAPGLRPPVRSSTGLPVRVTRRTKLLARRFVLGVTYGAGTAVGGSLAVWFFQSR